MTMPWKAVSLPDVRRLAVERVIEGESPREVAESLRVSCRSVERWRHAWTLGGEEALLTKPRHGRPTKLDTSQTQEVLSWVRQSACGFGFPTERWTAPRVAAVLRGQLGIAMNHRYLNDWLTRHGVTPQTPPRQAKERDDAKIAHWIRFKWPRIKKKRTTSAQPSLLPMKPDCFLLR